MSVIQVEDLVSYQLRTSYLNEIADGVGERLITLNEGFLNSAPFKAAGWRPNPALIKRTHSPPIPTAVASEYFQAPRAALSLEYEAEDGGMLTGGGADTLGPGLAIKRRRRREQMEEDDSSDLSDESDDEPDNRAAQQIKFAKMPLRGRSGSSPIQGSNLRQTTVASPRAAGRRGSQSALETVKERARRDTVTSSEVSSDNEFDASGFHRQREAARAGARAVKLSTRMNTEPTVGLKRHGTDLLEEEEDSDASDLSSNFNIESIDSTSILDAVENRLNASPRAQQVVGTPPKEFTRRSTIRRSAMPAPLQILVGELPPPRPLSTIRPISMLPPTSLLSEALNAKKTKPAIPFDGYASLSGQGDPDPIRLRIYAYISEDDVKSYGVIIKRIVHEGEGVNRPVNVADTIGLSLWRYNEEKLEPPLPSNRQNVNSWRLRMVEEDGQIDDDFSPLELKNPLLSFTTVNNRVGRARSNSKVYDSFALIPAEKLDPSESQSATPQLHQGHTGIDTRDGDITPRNTPKPSSSPIAERLPRLNPVITTTYRQNTNLADTPQQQQPTPMPNVGRGPHKLLRIHIHSADVAPGQMVTLDVTTDTYLAEVLDLVCRKRQLDKANHVLKLPNSGVVVLLDRAVSSIGNVSDLDLHRRRFATDGPLTMTGSPSSASPRPFLFNENYSFGKSKKGKIMGTHPLAKEVLKQNELGGNGTYRKYTVWRKQPMRFVGMNERILVLDGEYINIMPGSGGRILEGGGKTTTVHFSNVVGCKVSRKHPTYFKLLVYKSTDLKRYDFEARSADEAAEIVSELKKGVSPYRAV